jgi:hypothetical protein
MKAPQWKITAAATALTALIAGSRTSFGLFLSPINTSTGLGMASISLAAAVGQLAAGFALPFVGALARRHGWSMTSPPKGSHAFGRPMRDERPPQSTMPATFIATREVYAPRSPRPSSSVTHPSGVHPRATL